MLVRKTWRFLCVWNGYLLDCGLRYVRVGEALTRSPVIDMERIWR